MSCSVPGATHHLACDCREAESARLTRERDEARERERLAKLLATQHQERAESLSRELLAAIQARDSYRAASDLRVGMRREFEVLLNVGDTTAPETFESGLVRLRALVAAESRAARLAKAGAEFASQYGASAFNCRYDNSCDDSGREPRCEPCELRAAIAAEEGK